MMTLTPVESRVLGVLIEKAQTTPEQYPLTLNALVNGCNQKNNRDPVLALMEDAVLGAINGLRDKKLVVQVDLAGGRVPKYRHNVNEGLGVNAREMVILAELVLRGPQTIGELRGRASRMHALETLDVVVSTLEQLLSRPEPMVQRIPPAPGSRAERYAQLLCPEAHPTDAPAPSDAATAADPDPAAGPDVADRLARLEAEVSKLREALRKLAAGLGEADPFGT